MPEFELAELDYESPRESANVVNVERPTKRESFQRPKGNPADRESGPKGSDRVGLAGKGNAKAKTWKAPRKSDTETV
ncbi:hypothetical protein ABZ341_33075, partial [Streptomyces sp. NPDC006173]|uniref:hypothetical protein n=1 Tax=Streptomyces sp. NPDC006173 TaxID=3155349 RepID=UPI0033F1BECF